METLIAYTFAHDSTARATAGRARVEAYYGDLWDHQSKHQGYDGKAIGLHIWDNGHSIWPSWHDTGDLRVATLHTPLGYQRVIGDVPPYDAPAQLPHAVRRTPASFLELAPPFTMAVVDSAQDRLELFTDSIGVGRLFQLRLADGWVWSNRPAAALLFAGIPAVAAQRGWSFAAASGWFMDDSTPYDGVLAVPGATHIVADGSRRQRVVSRIEATSVWSTDSPDTVEETAEALQDVARSVGRVWPGRPTVDLSGGRDSRVVAAAFLAAGVEVKLNSYDAVPGELEVAESLVQSLKVPVEHAVSRKTAGTRSQVKPQPLELVERARRWHRYSEGLRPASYLFHAPPKSLAAVGHLAIGGAGGEVAHGHFYPPDVLQLDALPLATKLHAFSNHLQTRLTPAAGPAEASRDAVAGQIDNVLRAAVHGGIESATMLDYFYVVERLRRWGTTGERGGVVSPLLVPSFVRAAFALKPAQRVGNELHRGLVQQLVPEWADVPFFKPTRVRGSTPRVRRLADAADRDQIEDLLQDVEGFDRRALNTLWAASVAGASSATAEATLCQALWRATFDLHLADLNHLLPGSASPASKPSLARPRGEDPHFEGISARRRDGGNGRRSVVRRLVRWPVVRWAAATRGGQVLRRSAVGRAWRRFGR